MWAAQGLGKRAHVYLPLLSTYCLDTAAQTDRQTDRQVGERCVRVCSEHTHTHMRRGCAGASPLAAPSSFSPGEKSLLSNRIH